VEQNPKFHPEGDVWNHTMLVLDLAAQLRSQAAQPLEFMVSALCHDFGKITATTKTDGRIRSIGHELEGVPMVETFLRRLTNENGVFRYVLNMVQLHMRPNQMAGQRSSTKSMCKMFDASVAPEDLILLSKADHCSRPDAAPYEKTEQYLKVHLEIYRERMAQPCVMGADLIQAGFQPGKEFKDALDHAHKLQLAGVPKENALRQTIAFLKKRQEG
jgi:tRNA nucleotidyltransferase (CCA-adding enzyme)